MTDLAMPGFSQVFDLLPHDLLHIMAVLPGRAASHHTWG